MAFTTEQRLFSVYTPLPTDTLLIARWRAEEGLSQLYHFELELASERADIDALSLIGKPVHLRAETDRGQGYRIWHGYVASFCRTGQTQLQHSSDSQFSFYRMEIVPWLWFMLHHEDSRIFQNQSIPDIVETLFSEFGYSDYELQLHADYKPLVYCTQYRENVYQFISRLLERAGIYWYFRQDEKVATLVLTDHRDSHPLLDDDQPALRYHQEAFSAAEDVVQSLERSQAVRTGRIALNDYNFERPTLDLQVSLDSVVEAGDNRYYERYIHPAGYVERSAGDETARLLLEAEEARHETLQGTGTARAMGAGLLFDLQEHPQNHHNQRYLITSVTHQGSNDLGDEGGSDYSNSFRVLPYKVPYRSLPLTPKPRIAGPQTAVVTGPDSEEIYTDPHGRIKVHFHWDRRSQRNDKSSCWIRVAQMWAGRRWGAVFIPRIGHEVVVEFIEGDPDHPIVIGSVYNGDNPVPYPLPEQATKSTIKSLSSKDGDGFNEIRMEDKKGEEQLFLHAQKDLDLRVRNDRRIWVGQDTHEVVQRDAINETHRNQSTYVKQDRMTEVGRDCSLKVTGKQAIAIEGSRSTQIGGAVADSFKSHSESVNSSYYLNAASTVVIEAGAMITLRVAGSSITLSGAGVTIDGPQVRINSGGAPGAGTAASMVSPAQVLTAAVADNASSGEMGRHQVGKHSPLAELRGTQAPGMSTHDPDSEQNKDKRHYIEVQFSDEHGQPVAGETVALELPDGSTYTGSTDEKGLLKVSGLDAGNCKIRFPNLDSNAWEEA